ncbi:uncharacterized protein LOC109852371 [Pseudomyrmex gracilis]|uniref:uncharacterized protein LOC109852371 n=1 Tax=Pseudomyrmex gracilis TaxID=219809 RepID=UPI000995281B|nr:uncharacterized protein LOC109852371 [Pseudomyrmex gracilis]
MALKNLITMLLLANLVIFKIVVAIRVNNDADDFYKTYYLNKYNRNYRDDQKESKENARKLAKHIAIAITESNNYEEQSHSEDDEKVKRPRFIFPDQMLQMRLENEKPLMIPTNCGAQTFCENVSNYPQRFMDQLILNNSTLRHYTIQDVMPIKTRAYTEENPLCVPIERLIHPQSGRNMKNESLFIIQSNATGFVQAIRIETCLNENSECRLIDVPLGYSMTCKQKYIYRELYAISDTGEVIRDHFKLPASCCCHSKFDPQIVNEVQNSFKKRYNM